MAILKPLVSTLKVWLVFCLGNNLLLKSISMGCVERLKIKVKIIEVSNLYKLLLKEGCYF